MSGNERIDRMSRRAALLAAAGAGAGAALLGVPAAKAQPAAGAISVRTDGKYDTVALKKRAIRVTAVQSAMRAADASNPKPVLKANLDSMIRLIDAANGFPGKQDLVVFHEQPIMGWNPWTREEALKVAIEVPGPETDRLAAKAKEHGCYIAFGTYCRDDENWPGHLLLNGILIGPDGSIVANHWKQHNVRLNPEWSMFTTSAYDVLPRYIEMYGPDAVLPVARTDIGNLSLLISPFDPDIHRGLAIKGMEIGVRFSSGGFNAVDSQSSSLFNLNYTITVNQSLSPEQPGFPAYSGSGGTSIYGPFGREVAMAKSIAEEFVTATIPIGDFRDRYVQPDIPMAMLMPVYQQYVPRYNPGLQLEYIPTDLVDSARYLATKKNW